MGSPTVLYHWTCSHGAEAIRRDGAVKPHLGLSWWSDLNQRGRKTRAALGLTSLTLKCDRMEYRCIASDVGLLTPWDVFANTANPAFVEGLEMADGSKPEHWWVASEWVPVRSVRWQG